LHDAQPIGRPPSRAQRHGGVPPQEAMSNRPRAGLAGEGAAQAGPAALAAATRGHVGGTREIEQFGLIPQAFSVSASTV
jgi:hypothetical protein